MNNGNNISQRFKVEYEYRVAFTNNAFDVNNSVLRDIIPAKSGHDIPCRILFIIENSVSEAYPGLLAKISNYFPNSNNDVVLSSPPLTMNGGEKLKSFEPIEKLCAIFAENRLCRHSFIGIIGGGAFLDTVGLAASLVHRGIRQIRFPTTTLSQNDSGVGVKTGINMFGKKNFIGTFAPPFAVINDSSFLKTLSYRDWISGTTEAFKVAMIADSKFFDWLLSESAQLAERNELSMIKLVRRSAELHTTHIATSGDPFEMGSARPLDFGHWTAHKLESMTDGELRHGEAVGIGLLIDTLYAAETGLLDHSVFESLKSAFETMKLPLFHKALLEKKQSGELAVLDGIEDFREHLGGILHVTLPNGIGRKIEISSLKREIITKIIHSLNT
jgi:3-dehydroquinate synthase